MKRRSKDYSQTAAQKKQRICTGHASRSKVMLAPVPLLVTRGMLLGLPMN